MVETKEKILLVALRLFAKDGYEAVSVSDISGELAMTKGALYKHYKNKRDIFDSIVARMEERDEERAKDYGVPEGTLEQMEDKYRNASIDYIAEYSKAQFRYWTEDDFASSFRKMLTLEQYRNREMGMLYGQYLASGPVGYMTDLFRSLGIPHPYREAVMFYAPMFLLYNIYDESDNREEIMKEMDDLLERSREHLIYCINKEECKE